MQVCECVSEERGNRLHLRIPAAINGLPHKPLAIQMLVALFLVRARNKGVLVVRWTPFLATSAATAVHRGIFLD